MKTNKTIGYAIIEAICLLLCVSILCMFLTFTVLIKSSTDIFLNENYVEYFSTYLNEYLPEHTDTPTTDTPIPTDTPITTNIPPTDTLTPIEDIPYTTDIPITPTT